MFSTGTAKTTRHLTSVLAILAFSLISEALFMMNFTPLLVRMFDHEPWEERDDEKEFGWPGERGE